MLIQKKVQKIILDYIEPIYEFNLNSEFKNMGCDSMTMMDIILEIEDYVNIWADHKRNDLKKIEFLVKDDLLPYEILIHFKKRVFKLERI